LRQKIHAAYWRQFLLHELLVGGVLWDEFLVIWYRKNVGAI